MIGALDFRPGLQASRRRFDDRWMLEAVKDLSGTPPAISCRSHRAHTAKAGDDMGSSGFPCFVFPLAPLIYERGALKGRGESEKSRHCEDKARGNPPRQSCTHCTARACPRRIPSPRERVYSGAAASLLPGRRWQPEGLTDEECGRSGMILHSVKTCHALPISRSDTFTNS